MIRRLNYTGRHRIKRSCVTIRLRTEGNGSRSFDAHIDLSDMSLPEDAQVFVEAYHASSYMRFTFGTVGQMIPPDDRRLTDIMANCRPRFRVKVVDRRQALGRILAVADKLVPLREEDEAAERGNLLPVEYRDLGAQIWRLDLTDSPILELNNRVDGIADVARSDGQFLALVYPEALRQILLRVVLSDREGITDPDMDPDDWRCQWLRFAGSLPGVAAPVPGLDDDELRDWVDDAVSAFCSWQETRQRFAAATAQEGD